MKFMPDKFRTYFKNTTNQRIWLLICCTLAVIGAGIGASVGYHAIQASAALPDTSSSVSSTSVHVSSTSSTSVGSVSSTSLWDSSSDSIEEKKDPVPLALAVTSATQDLNVNIVDKAGAIVRDVLFHIHIQGQDKNNADYDKLFAIDLLDGNLYLSWIPEGNYLISLEEIDDFIVPEPVKFNVEKYEIIYEKIEDIEDQIVDEGDVNVSEDDNAFGGNDSSGAETPTPPPTTTDTVTFVESSVKEEQQEVKDKNGNFLYTYTYEVGKNGFLLLSADGSESDVEPVLKDDALVSGMRYVKTGSTADPAVVLASAAMYRMAGGALIPRLDPIPLTDEPAASSQESAASSESAGSTAPSSSASSEAVSSSESAGTAPSESTSTPESSSPSSGESASGAESPSVPDSSEGGSGTPSVPDTGSGESGTKCTVTFVNPDGSPLGTSQVTVGGTATAPENPVMKAEGKRYVFTGWNAPLEQIESDKTIVAIYDIYTAEPVNLFRDDNTPDPLYKIKAVKQTKTVKVYTGWQTLDGKTYYYTAEHKKVTGWQVIQGISYFFNNDGVRSDCMGVDVSRWNNNIDWVAVKNAGIDFAIIRVGYRGYGTGKLVQDPLAKANLAGATAAGIKVGVYVFSQAINLEEAIEEASMALEMVKGYSITYPIFIDSEYSTSAKDGRADALSTAQRTAICEAFCRTVANSGYKTGVYASKSWFMYQLNVAALEKYTIWMAHYTTATDYTRRYDMWQYTSTGSVPGISGGVDMNLSYLNY